MSNEIAKSLTIAVPTYNRAEFLREGLSRVLRQTLEYADEIEIIVSNNCSTDHTDQVVQEFLSAGAPIKYNVNTENIGPDGNFEYCFKNATAKYVWILGDDDYLEEGIIGKLLEIMRESEYGLIHLKTSDNGDSLEIITDKIQYMNKISYWITFISSNIVSAKYMQTINFPKYRGTLFLQIPVYMTAVVEAEKNAVINFPTLLSGQDIKSNGGYNIFEVFITNYLLIIKEFRSSLSRRWYEMQKKRILKEIVYHWMCRLQITSDHGLRFKTDNWFRIIFMRYWYEPYFYLLMLKLLIKKISK